MSSNDASAKLNRVLFIGPYPPPYSGPEMGMKLFLESSLQEKYSISFLCTNVRKSNKNKGRFGLAMVFAFARFFSILLWKLVTRSPQGCLLSNHCHSNWLGRKRRTLFDALPPIWC